MLTSSEKIEYFNATQNRATRKDLTLAVDLVDNSEVAIDCGCGSGSDIEYLRNNDFLVYGFDIESEAIDRCQQRFGNDKNVILCVDSFASFSYPRASLILADASLFFCPQSEFHEVWRKISAALNPNGIFVGSFLGPDDSMAGDDYDKNAFWPDVFVTNEEQIRSWFDDFDILSFSEIRESGETVNGASHNWHIFSIVARKKV